ncbi:FIST signal transduction protein [Vreelandella aquamarina]|uniref:FIST signal transduction protein n=1 Tax=Vreelandella aquamarina TaxID=77097 RepID=UPI003850EDE8
MQLMFEPTGTPEAFGAALTALAAQAGVEAVLVLACDANGWQPEYIDTWLMGACVPVIGGIFPQIAYQGQNHTQGTLLIGMADAPHIGVVEGLSDPTADFAQTVEVWAEQWPLEAAEGTHLVLVDGLASRIGALLESLFFTLGLNHNFIGGGAGSLSFEQRPCIMTPQGLRCDVALVALLPVASFIGVTHGWTPISDSAIVTSSDRNVIKSIDWQPAADVYKAMIYAHSGENITHANFFSIAKSYPLGIAKFGAEMVVRDPLKMTQDGAVVCVGEVPEGCTVKLLHGNPESLIAAAGQAREAAFAAAPKGQVFPDCLLIDCISRVLFLEDDMARELEAVSQQGQVFGAFTLGEIANNGSDYLEFYNKTTVLGLLDTSLSDLKKR